MGQRIFYQQMLSDTLHGADGRASDEIDVVTLKDYMQVRLTEFLFFFRIIHVNFSIQVYLMNYHHILVDEQIIGDG